MLISSTRHLVMNTRSVVTVSFVKAQTRPKEKTNCTADGDMNSKHERNGITLEEIKTAYYPYEEAAIPRRIVLDHKKWTLRNPFKIGIN